MGARTQVKIIDNAAHQAPLYLYAHWGAGGPTLEAVRRALARRQRWTDGEYLARIIFSEMIRGDLDGETGFGIGTAMHGDIEELIVVNADSRTVRYMRNWNPIGDVEEQAMASAGAAEISFEQFARRYKPEES